MTCSPAVHVSKLKFVKNFPDRLSPSPVTNDPTRQAQLQVRSQVRALDLRMRWKNSDGAMAKQSQTYATRCWMINSNQMIQEHNDFRRAYEGGVATL
ncbi:hypothetical protein PsorP6_016465 [Peronosclerospora sorghi]|uniref:Uncharacterized protein n=1 Tax=Peronosclerospora sorghi TaxID=230839 RepID=A0ACC0VMK3_9STRA|nr:hypothetical protein PsorP6_016465 [Peronosclerospora sorghi]